MDNLRGLAAGGAGGGPGAPRLASHPVLMSPPAEQSERPLFPTLSPAAAAAAPGAADHRPFHDTGHFSSFNGMARDPPSPFAGLAGLPISSRGGGGVAGALSALDLAGAGGGAPTGGLLSPAGGGSAMSLGSSGGVASPLASSTAPASSARGSLAALAAAGGGSGGGWSAPGSRAWSPERALSPPAADVSALPLPPLSASRSGAGLAPVASASSAELKELRRRAAADAADQMASRSLLGLDAAPGGNGGSASGRGSGAGAGAPPPAR
jgi:hypothetical protein